MLPSNQNRRNYLGLNFSNTRQLLRAVAINNLPLSRTSFGEGALYPQPHFNSHTILSAMLVCPANGCGLMLTLHYIGKASMGTSLPSTLYATSTAAAPPGRQLPLAFIHSCHASRLLGHRHAGAAHPAQGSL
jgi:hypothetical protein